MGVSEAMSAEPKVSQGEHSQVITTADETYEVEVGGRRDPTPVAIIIENVGETPIVNPRLTVEGRGDWYSREAMAAEVTRGCETDEEKAFALWRFFRHTRYQMGNGDPSTLQPVRYLNVYGYGICGHTAAAFVSLCEAAGLRARVWEIWHHTVSEVFYNGGWHMLDANAKYFYPTWDNRSVASIEQLERDPSLVRRCFSPGGRPRLSFAQLYATTLDNYIEHGYDHQMYLGYTMAITLRPGERIVRWWEPKGKFYGQGWRRTPRRYANGQIVYKPDLAGEAFLRTITARGESREGCPNPFNMTTVAADGQSANLHVGRKHDSVYDRPSHWGVDVRSPYVIVGGRVRAKLHKGGSGRYDRLSLHLSAGEGPDRRRELWKAEGTGDFEVDLDLDEHFQRENAPPLYGYTVQLQAMADIAAAPAVQSGIDELELVTDIQVAPESLPRLSLGKNVVRYWDESGDARRVKVTLVYEEHHDNAPPDPPALKKPADKARVKSLAPTLTWEPARDPDGDQVVDYYIMVSPNPRCVWPISANFEGNLGPVTEFAVPEGWLVPGQTYYWRVKARSDKGRWGAWSPIRSFRAP